MNQPIPPEVRAAWDAGRKIEAIKLLREATGLGLAEAKALLERGASVAGPAYTPGQPLPATVRAALDAGNTVDAIRRMREATGLGLKEAKDVVEAAAGASRSANVDANRGLAPGEVRHGVHPFVLVLAVAAAAIAAMVYFFALR